MFLITGICQTSWYDFLAAWQDSISHFKNLHTLSFPLVNSTEISIEIKIKYEK